jgi:hypothetical protein
MRRQAAIAFLTASTILGLTAAAHARVPSGPAGHTDIIAVSGGVAPGGGNYGLILDPMINNAGQVAFRADLTNTTHNSGVFRKSVAGPAVAIARGASVGVQAINSSGTVLFSAQQFGPELQFALMAGAGGATTLITETGQIAPGGGSFPFAYLDTDPQFNDAGEASFAASFSRTTGAVAGLYRGTGGALTEIARLGRPAPGGGNYSYFDYGFPLSSSGEVGFKALLNNGGSGLYRGNGVTTTAIVRQGDPSPAGDGSFGSFEFIQPTMNDLGQLAFVGQVNQPGGGSYRAVYRGSGDVPTEIARTGQPTSGGKTFAGFSYGPVINSAGQIAFAASLQDFPGDPTFDIALYRADGNALTEVIRRGDPAPDGNGILSDVSAPALNHQGKMAFMAAFDATAGGASDDSGLYYFDPAQGVIQVAREGQSFLGSTITVLNFSHSLSHVHPYGDEQSGLNNHGQVAYFFRLADGRTGVALWQIPEPCGSALLAAMTMGSALFRQRGATFHGPRERGPLAV